MVELRIEGVAHGGAGVGRLERYVVFVDGAFPGELVRAEDAASKRDYANARVVEVLEPSPDRVPQRCDHEGQPCPGSPWQALRYERQLELKHELVDDALRRIGHLDGFELEPIVPTAEPWRYRNKMEYSFGTSEDGTLALGFHRRGRWDVVDDARDCMLASERSNAVRNLVRDWCAQRGPGRRWTAAPATGFLRNLVVREGRRTGELRSASSRQRASSSTRSSAAAVRDRFPRRDVLWTRTDRLAEVTQGGDDGGAGRFARAARGALRPALPHLAGGVLPDQHRDGRAALRARARLRAAVRQRARVRPLLRDRHAQPGAGAARRRGVGPGRRARGDRRRDRERAR